MLSVSVRVVAADNSNSENSRELIIVIVRIVES